MSLRCCVVEFILHCLFHDVIAIVCFISLTIASISNMFLINLLNSIITNILNVCKLTFNSLRSQEIVEDIGSSLIYNTSARHERHECNTSDTNATRVSDKRHVCNTSETRATQMQHKCDTRATRMTRVRHE